MSLAYNQRQGGFNLIEMAIVMVILGTLLGGLLMPLSAQRDMSQRTTTEQQLEEIRNALMGFAQLNGRLPCPTNINSNGLELRNATTLNCTFANGFVPYATLGLQGSIQNQRLVDIWQMPIQYRLSAVSTWQYAKKISLTTPAANLQVCDTSSCTNIIAPNLVAVIFSTGKDGPDIPASTSPDQVLNRTPGTTSFVSRSPTEYEASGTEFDDLLIWIGSSQLIYELSKAGQL
jgi:prepilin-type N-terminal cleavage/methylation domain-containing protein